MTMSDVDHKLHYGSGRKAVDSDPTEIEIAAMWNSFDEFILTKHSAKFHLFDGCERLNDTQCSTQRRKDVSCYPVGFKSVCKWCYLQWRDEFEALNNNLSVPPLNLTYDELTELRKLLVATDFESPELNSIQERCENAEANSYEQ